MGMKRLAQTAERALRLGEAFPTASQHELRGVADALIRASDIVIDWIYDDAGEALRSPIGESPVNAFKMIICDLPASHAHRYTPVVIKAFGVAAASLTRQLLKGWRGPDCVAEALLGHLILNTAVTQPENSGLPVPEGWRDTLEPFLFTDLRHLALYPASYSFFPEGYRPHDVDVSEVPRFEDWFKPFKGRAVAPYTLTS